MPRSSYSPRTNQGAKRQLIYGIVLLVIGIGITVGTYSWASQDGGGTYFISFGPIIFGLLRIGTAIPVLIRTRGQAQSSDGWAPPPFPSRPGPGPWAPGQSGLPPTPAAGGLAPWAASAGPGSNGLAWGGPPASAAPVPAAPVAAALPRPATSPVAGWYTDPSGANQVRWWDGTSWTGQTRLHQ